jgi:aspartate racemase
MQQVGIVGGIGPESTVDYYKGIISQYRSLTGDDNYPPIVINSINMTEMLSYVASKEYDKLTALLVAAISGLKNAGADFAVIASNTPHVVFDQVKEKSSLPLLSIVEETYKKACLLNLKKLLLIGTAFTMKNTFYQKCFGENNISLILPSPEEQQETQRIIFYELEEGIVNPDSKKRLVKICTDIISQDRIDGIILGCTELPLMIKEDDFTIAVLNTTRIHVNAIVARLIDERKVKRI